MAEERDRLGNKSRNDNKIGPKFHFAKKNSYGASRGPKIDADKKPYGESRGSRSDADKKGPYSESRGPRPDADKKGSYGEKRGPRFDADKKGPYSESRGPRFDADKKGPYGEKRGSRFDTDKKSPYGEKRGSRFDTDKKSPYGEKRGPRIDADNKAPYEYKGDPRFAETDKKEAYAGKRAPRFDADKKAPYAGGPKQGVEAQDEFNGENDKLEGRNSILEALKANRTINKLFVAKGDREGSIRQIIAIARQKKIIITEVERNALDSMSSTKAHQGIIAFVAVKEYVEVDDILKIAEEKGQPPFIIILDEITDPHNLGAVLRTANAVGAHGVIIPKRRAIGLTSTVSKASAGAIEYMPVSRVTNISQTLEYLKKKNVWIVGTDSSGEKAFYDSDLKGPIALVVGSEGEGISKQIRENCDFVVNIPMKGEISSLNASVAAAIVMYEILKQRGKV